MFQQVFDSPIGQLLIEANNLGVKKIHFSAEHYQNLEPNHITKEAVKQLTAYFHKELKTFDIPIAPEGTPFQKKVWNELMTIPFGKTISYLELARALGDPKVIRAAGTANGKNPVPIIIPCHRVIGSDGSLTGYAGGLQNKKWLLTLESAIQPDLFS